MDLGGRSVGLGVSIGGGGVVGRGVSMGAGVLGGGTGVLVGAGGFVGSGGSVGSGGLVGSGGSVGSTGGSVGTGVSAGTGVPVGNIGVRTSWKGVFVGGTPVGTGATVVLTATGVLVGTNGGTGDGAWMVAVGSAMVGTGVLVGTCVLVGTRGLLGLLVPVGVACVLVGDDTATRVGVRVTVRWGVAVGEESTVVLVASGVGVARLARGVSEGTGLGDGTSPKDDGANVAIGVLLATA